MQTEAPSASAPAPAESAPPAPVQAAATATAAAVGQCELRLLLVSGDSFRLVAGAHSTVRELKQRVISEQPRELVEFLSGSAPGGVPPPTKVEEIRLLHLGKLLEDSKTLRECNFAEGPAASPTTVHISCRVPSTAMDDSKDKLNKKAGACCTLV